MRRPGLAAFLLGAILTAAGAGSLWARIDLPPPADRSVHDFAGVVSPEDARTMERRHRTLYEKTGVAIVVITEPSLEGEPIEDFATRVGHEWGAGRKGEDRGIVVALAMEERRIFIATGYGVEGYLPDGRIGAILDRVAVPFLRQGRNSEALVETSAELVAASAREYGAAVEDLERRAAPRGRARRGGGGALSGLFALLVMAVVFVLMIRHPILFAILMSGRGRRGGWGGGPRIGGGFGGGFRGGGGFGGGFGGFGGGGFGGGGAGRGF